MQFLTYKCRLTFLYFFNISLFFYLSLAVLGLSRGTRDLQNAGSFVAVRGLLSSCGAQAPEHVGSLAVVRA